MGMFDQMKMATEMMKNMDPAQLKELMAQAEKSQGAIADNIRKIVDEEIVKRGLVSRAEVERMLRDAR